MASRTDPMLEKKGVAERSRTTAVTGMDRSYRFPPSARRASYWSTVAQPVLLLVIDGMFLTGAIGLSLWVSASWAGLLGLGSQPPAPEPGSSIAFGGLSLALLALTGSYESARRGSLARDCVRVIGVVSVGVVLLGLVTLLFTRAGPELVRSAFLWTAATLALVAAKLTERQVIEALRRLGAWCQGLIIVGDGESARYALQKLREGGGLYQILGLVDLDEGRSDHTQPGGIPMLGNVKALPQIMEAHNPCEVLICATPRQYAAVGEHVHSLIPSGTTVNLALNPLMGRPSAQGTRAVGGSFPIVRVRTGYLSWQYQGAKRCLDLVLGATALIAFAWLMALIAVAVKLTSPGPVLFRQIRIGRLGQPFVMYKFRSMRQDAEAKLGELSQQNEAAGPMFKMRKDPRITRVGGVLRRFSLDELPQLFNVLEGNMSLVGPRPPLPNEVEQYQEWHFRRLEAVPGMTGLWQVDRGPEVSFDEMVHLDLAYINHWSLALDLAILWRTVAAVIGTKGAY